MPFAQFIPVQIFYRSAFFCTPTSLGVRRLASACCVRSHMYSDYNLQLLVSAAMQIVCHHFGDPHRGFHIRPLTIQSISIIVSVMAVNPAVMVQGLWEALWWLCCWRYASASCCGASATSRWGSGALLPSGRRSRQSNRRRRRRLGPGWAS